MNLERLPPVRRPVPLFCSNDGQPLSSTVAFVETYVGSGTQALALAIRQAIRLRPNRADVILPAYGCPDLIAATLWAGGKPVLVDIYADQWGYDVRSLESTVGSGTAAVVAVNLLGMGDQAEILKGIAEHQGAALIQDSAQYLPRQPRDWCADYVVFSFGRGKPLNLLGGGALLSRTDDVSRDLSTRVPSAGDRFKESLCGAIAFNLTTHPVAFSLVSALPGLGLGATRFSPLHDVSRLELQAERRIRAAYTVFSRGHDYSIELWKGCIEKWQRQGLEPVLCDGAAPNESQRLRLALLAPTQRVRDRMVNELDSRGLGASRMYEFALNAVGGVPDSVARQGPFPAAAEFASRLLTLPTHTCVKQRHVEAVDKVVSEILRAGS